MFKKGCQGIGSFMSWSSCAGMGKRRWLVEIKHAWLEKGAFGARGGCFVHVVRLVMGKDEIVGGDRTCHS